LLDNDAVRAIRQLMPLVSLITPNLAEAAALLDTSLAATLPDMRLQAVALQEMGAQHVLIKGGHLDDTPDAVDLLLHLDGEEVLRAPRVNTVNTHGTGCTLSSALAALRPQRESWVEAALDAKAWLTAALVAADSLEIGQNQGRDPGSEPGQNPVRGHGPVHHFHAIWDR
jgi:hydroxymethylpyrimidine/phosphomethylpyrimidine kinase